MSEDRSDRTMKNAGDVTRSMSTTLPIAVSTNVRGQGGYIQLKRYNCFSKTLSRTK